MLTLEQAAAFADALDDEQMERAVERFDVMLRRGLHKHEALVVSIEAELIVLARRLMHQTATDNRRAAARRP